MWISRNRPPDERASWMASFRPRLEVALPSWGTRMRWYMVGLRSDDIGLRPVSVPGRGVGLMRVNPRPAAGTCRRCRSLPPGASQA